jgi:ATP/maltotriose-dependent transcriptional regulator MalT
VPDDARAALAREQRAWASAYAELAAADRAGALGGEQLERLAEAAYLTGGLVPAVDAWTRAHTHWLAAGDRPRAARCGFWVAFVLLNNGEPARGGGWVDRVRRLLDGHARCAEEGYVAYGEGLRAVLTGDAVTAHEAFLRAGEVAAELGDRQLETLARVGTGRCAIYLGDVPRGVALLDEAMVSVGAQEVSPIAAGDVYCTVIEGFQELFDLQRVQEWTAALSHWCDAQPQLVLYRGQCLVHRAEVMQLHGAWQDAEQEADRACARLVEPTSQPALGAGLYLRAELHRLRGEEAAAERAYDLAHQHGRDAQPGLALLRLAQGRVETAAGALRRGLEAAGDPVSRCRLLPAHVQVALAAGDAAGARLGAEELGQVAQALGSPYLQAQADAALGAVLLAEGDAGGAGGALRRALEGWLRLEAPYDAARTRVLLAAVCRALGDEDGEALELQAAARLFQELGAAPDLARLSGPPPDVPGGLSERELEVLRLLAAGRSNRAVAQELVISEKTVARHVSNIFTKLGVGSRSAATAYAYEHGLAGPRG